MESIATMITTWVGSADSQQTMFIMLAAGAIFVMFLGVSYFVMGATNPVRKRLVGGMDVDDEPDQENRMIDIPTLVGPAAQWLIPTADIERSKTTRFVVRNCGGGCRVTFVERKQTERMEERRCES